MFRKVALLTAFAVVGTTSVKAQDLAPDPVVTVFRLAYPVVNREGDVMNYMCISADGKQTYWNNIPQGLQLSPGWVHPPRTTFSRSRMVVQNGWKHSIDANSGLVAASVPVSQSVTTAKPPLPPANPAPRPEDGHEIR